MPSRCPLWPQLRATARLTCLALLLVTGCNRSGKQAAAEPPVVEVAPVLQRDVPIYREWVAVLNGYVNADIQARVDGYLIAQKFTEGSLVHKNEVLFEIDPRPFVAALNQARGQLAEAQANAARAERDVERDRPLAAARAIPRQQLETDIELARAAAAAVTAAAAQVQQAELNLGFTKVRSLIDGIVGITQVQIGNLVSATSVLTTVSQVQPMKAFFAITEQEYLQASRRFPGNAEEAFEHHTPLIPFYLKLADGSTYSHTGHFLFADRQVDSLTGTIRVAASFPNPQRVLRPGQFGRVRAALQISRNALLVPQRAVTQLQSVYQLAIVNDSNKVNIRTVLVGPKVDSLWVIERGVHAGELVVVEGVQKVHEGMIVRPVPYYQRPPTPSTRERQPARQRR